MLLLLLALMGCSKSDDGEEKASIDVKITTSSFDTINMCDIGSGNNGTLFVFTISYTKLSVSEVDKVLFDVEWSNGDKDSAVETNFTDNGTSVVYDWCYRFGSLSWVEINQRLVSKDGTISNISKVRVNKPSSAN